ncbi:malate synthase [Paenibacillus camelliae]|uniref:malate synthase n=1 Tax=Paenibacillus camelliae TaxID=512410 RepID=UPI00203D320A|nr:malate synthase [Paenibacillus camelliae]
MNLINKEITHKVFGNGNIVEQNDSVITVHFNDGIKKFVYPDAFETFISLNDQDTAKNLQKIIAEKEIEKQALEKKLKEEIEQQVLEQQRRDKIKNLKIHESSQIVLWLDEEEQQVVFNDWQVSSGKVQNGANQGQPNKVARLRPNSACLLTARDSDQPETERRILGLYMVTESFVGDELNDGMIPAHAEFRIKLSEQEAATMYFWNYYVNKNFPHRMTWNSGKFRYFDNVWTAQILKDIIASSSDKENIEQAERFLEYFCEMNQLDINNIPDKNGALV